MESITLKTSASRQGFVRTVRRDEDRANGGDAIGARKAPPKATGWRRQDRGCFEAYERGQLFALDSDTQFSAQDVQLNGACTDQARSCRQFQSNLVIGQVFHLLYSGSIGPSRAHGCPTPLRCFLRG